MALTFYYYTLVLVYISTNPVCNIATYPKLIVIAKQPFFLLSHMLVNVKLLLKLLVIVTITCVVVTFFLPVTELLATLKRLGVAWG